MISFTAAADAYRSSASASSIGHLRVWVLMMAVYHEAHGISDPTDQQFIVSICLSAGVRFCALLRVPLICFLNAGMASCALLCSLKSVVFVVVWLQGHEYMPTHLHVGLGTGRYGGRRD